MPLSLIGRQQPDEPAIVDEGLNVAALFDLVVELDV